ncbi:inositol monophosphatase family protein [Desulfosarcina ovata]|uniref:Inositol-phosphate phosphatase n=2 Tax=Desulfosarcina ovata TaxID=83564 RepID=A0A5K8A5W1_9BACT|nr:inositol monophosphatase family protein [Desulfosarcina ovata]BBO80703.1 inositol-phosphate phosphatase [Desulfosarcina ovata subsp. sediminis]BBO87915.1 inositol-phosphate phosphatase [Desulfosarcina ovata subsp. ovata]
MTKEPSHGIEALTAFALNAIRGAGQIALESFSKGGSAAKFDEGLITRAELQISQRFRQGLDQSYPDHQMFTSRTPDTQYTHDSRRYLWIFDPIDGVDNYQAGIPIWGMSLALFENFWPVFGAFYMPATGDLFYAQAGGKAYWGEREIRMADDRAIDDESLMFTFSRFHRYYLSEFPGKIRNLGCTGAHLCYVAMGRADIAVTANETFQDLAATRVIVEAAGGRIFKTSGEKFYLNDYLNGERIEEHLLVTAPGNCQALLDCLQKRS